MASGDELWSTEIPSVSGWAPAQVTSGGLLVVAPEYEEPFAVSTADGSAAPVPPGYEPPAAPVRGELPPEYRLEDERLWFRDVDLLAAPHADVDPPTVRRIAGLSFVSDRTHGFVILDDRGEQLHRIPVVAADYGPGLILELDGSVAVVTSDGDLYLVEI